MARNVSVVVTDDLDGSEGAQVVAFGLDGVSYEIDLGQANRARLADAIDAVMWSTRRHTPIEVARQREEIEL